MMFCKQCGSEIKDSANYCNSCGTKVYSEPQVQTMIFDDKTTCEIIQGNKYIFFPELRNREKIIKYFGYFIKAYEMFFGLLLLAFIGDQFEAEEGYKLAVYIIRYLVAFSIPSLILEYMYILINVFKYKEEQMTKNYSKNVLLGLIILEQVFITVAIVTFINPSDLTSMKWFSAIAFGEFWDIIGCFKWNILMLIISTVISLFIDKKVLINAENE